MMNEARTTLSALDMSPIVWERVSEVTGWLEDALRADNARACIERIECMPCSFLRGLMIPGSDIDSLIVWVRGHGSPLNILNAEFNARLSMTDLRLMDDYENAPLVLPIERDEELSRVYGLQTIDRLSIYEKGRFRNRNVIAAEANARLSMLFEKNAARIKLLLVADRIEPEFVFALLEHEDEDEVVARDLYKTLESPPRLSRSACELVLKLDALYRGRQRVLQVSSQRVSECQSALEELAGLHLTWTLDDELMITWRTYGIRWHDSFFRKRISVVDGSGRTLLYEVSNNLSRAAPASEDALIEQIGSDDPREAELAVRQAVRSNTLPVANVVPACIEHLGRLSIFVRASLVEGLQFLSSRHPALVEDELTAAFVDEVSSRRLGERLAPSMENRRKTTAIKLYLLINLITSLGRARGRSAATASVFYDTVLSAPNMPDKVFQDTLRHVGELYNDIGSSTQLARTLFSVASQSATSRVERTRRIASDLVARWERYS